MLTQLQIEMATHFGIVLLNPMIEEDFYMDASYLLQVARDEFPDDPIELRVNGNGGGSDDSFGIGDLIKADGNIDGVILGSANSGHGIIWASCATRYISNNSRLGLHPSAIYFSPETALYTKNLSLAVGRLINIDEMSAELYSSVSRMSKQWWLDEINKGSSTTHPMYYAEVLQTGIALPYSQRPRRKLVSNSQKTYEAATDLPEPEKVVEFEDGEAKINLKFLSSPIKTGAGE